MLKKYMEFIVYTFSYTQGKYFAFEHVYCSILSQSFGKVVCEREATVKYCGVIIINVHIRRI